jgi:hypothetical protein
VSTRTTTTCEEGTVTTTRTVTTDERTGSTVEKTVIVGPAKTLTITRVDGGNPIYEETQ